MLEAPEASFSSTASQVESNNNKGKSSFRNRKGSQKITGTVSKSVRSKGSHASFKGQPNVSYE